MVIGLTPYPQHCLMSMSTDRLNDQSIDNFEQDCPMPICQSWLRSL